MFALNSHPRESELCSLLRPVEWQMMAGEFLDGQVSRVTSVEDSLKNIRGKEGTPQIVIPKISQETLAEMVGTTRSRVSFFMNRFRELGFIDYEAGSGLQVHTSLLTVVLHD